MVIVSWTGRRSLVIAGCLMEFGFGCLPECRMPLRELSETTFTVRLMEANKRHGWRKPG
jgi:hypothetical protein